MGQTNDERIGGDGPKWARRVSEMSAEVGLCSVAPVRWVAALEIGNTWQYYYGATPKAAVNTAWKAWVEVRNGR